MVLIITKYTVEARIQFTGYRPYKLTAANVYLKNPKGSNEAVGIEYDTRGKKISKQAVFTLTVMTLMTFQHTAQQISRITH